MPGNGPPPKPVEQRRRRNKLAPLAPSSPQPQPKLRGEWSPEVRVWWKVLGDSAMAPHCDGMDWEQLQQVAPLLHRFWTDGHDVKLLTEIRLNVAELHRRAEARARAQRTPPPVPASTGRKAGGRFHGLQVVKPGPDGSTSA